MDCWLEGKAPGTRGELAPGFPYGLAAWGNFLVKPGTLCMPPPILVAPYKWHLSKPVSTGAQGLRICGASGPASD